MTLPPFFTSVWLLLSESHRRYVSEKSASDDQDRCHGDDDDEEDKVTVATNCWDRMRQCRAGWLVWNGGYGSPLIPAREAGSGSSPSCEN